MPTQPLIDVERPPSAPARAPRGAAVAVLFALACTIAASAALARWLELSSLVYRTAVLGAAGGALVLWLAGRLPGAVFGPANSVTLVRGALAVLLLALLGAAPTPALGWTLVGLGVAGAVLDGVDGALARARREASEFGARFDMETDALLILVLAALVWQHGKAGAWIIAAGLLRYLFVAASYVAPWLGAPLPPSRRRQAVCVVQIVSLLAALTPAVPLPWSAAIAFAGLAALVWSFAVDVHWLATRARS